MGASKGYSKKSVLTSEGESLLSRLLSAANQNIGQNADITQNPLYQQSVEATKQFLPGGEGFAPIQAEAQRQFQQQTIPNILNSLGAGNKGSSALNQALAGAGQNLNSSLASQLAQMQLQAAQQGAGLAQIPYAQGLSSAQLGLSTSPFAYMQQARPFWQDAILAGINAGGTAARSLIGIPSVPKTPSTPGSGGP